MEEKETWESEPVDLQCAEQTDLVSLIISGEEEAAQEDSDLGHYSGGEEDGTANGHIGEESEGGVATPISSPGTSYWSITEGPDHPLLLSPAAGPTGRKPRRVQRASRPGLSRIPGRDHRRYYHEYWRMEYLMDFDPRRHGMICMVCGSSLATLKLSTIKRHIRQKHPDSLLWSTADKEVIRSGWESHLGLEGAPLPPPPPPPLAADTVMGEQPTDSGTQQTTWDPSDPTQADPPTVCLSPLSPVDEDPPPEEEHRHQGQQQQQEEEEAGPSAQTLERYLNDSLHAWFRQEFLMEYEAEAGRLLCMVCGGQLPSLHLDHIKGHVLHSHPGSLVYSSEEKHCILQAWAHAHEEANNVFIKSESNTKDSEVSFFSQGTQSLQTMAEPHRQFEGALTQGAGLTGEDSPPNRAPPPPPATPPSGRPPRKRRLRTGEPWRLRLDYLVAYGPQGRGTYCMVCSQMLLETKVTSFRRHIQVCHPETSTLSRQDREAMAAAWTKDYHTEDTRIKEEPHPNEASDANPSEEASSDGRSGAPGAAVKTEDGGDCRGKARDGNHSGGGPSRHGHYPGKDQRRNYQARWRMEYLMDYDWRRHGLICMVCGATLATLKVSTIKRHIQQVHPRSLEYGPAEKQRVLLAHGHSHADAHADGGAPNHACPGGRFSPHGGGAAPALAQGHFGT